MVAQSSQVTLVLHVMADQPILHPVAPRIKDGPKKPHIAPDIHAYREAHKLSLGHESDKWWAKV